MTVAIRTKSREPSSHTKLRSLRMSRPHAPVAIWSHERPSRDTAARPSSTVTTVTIAVVSSRRPRPIVAATKLPVKSPIDAIATPPMRPSTIITPMRPLASPTCAAGTRSGTYPWKGPCAKFDEIWSRTTKATTET